MDFAKSAKHLQNPNLQIWCSPDMVLAVIVHRAPTWSLSGGLCSPPRQVLGRETCTIGEEHTCRQTVRSVGDRPTGRPSSLHRVAPAPYLESAGPPDGGHGQCRYQRALPELAATFGLEKEPPARAGFWRGALAGSRCTLVATPHQTPWCTLRHKTTFYLSRKRAETSGSERTRAEASGSVAECRGSVAECRGPLAWFHRPSAVPGE